MRSNKVMIRVGGGFATLEEYIRQNGPFECIKIYKRMRGDLKRGEEPVTFKDAVLGYMEKLKADEKCIRVYKNTNEEEMVNLFENSIEYLKAKQDEKGARFKEEQAHRRGTAGKSGSPRGSFLNSPKNQTRSSQRARGSPVNDPNGGNSSRGQGTSPRN